jgi:DNA (cytosine-5)-methyltransferase 1
VSARARPRLVDAFCGGGGASMGYYRAGFDVVGIDLCDQPSYPFDLIKGDAVDLLASPQFMAQFDAAAASPPCQGYSKMTGCRPGLAGQYPRLIEVVRDLCRAWGGPWVIENVDGAGLAEQDDLFGAHGALLCGAMFGRELYRHRCFEASFPLRVPHHPRHGKPASKAGHWKPGTVISVAGNCAPAALARQVMDIDWMPRGQLAEAIPPYFTEYLGMQLREHLASANAAASTPPPQGAAA